MINNLAIRMITLAVGLSALPFVLSERVCPDGTIGIGTSHAITGPFELSIIYSNDCGVIDSKDGNICSSYRRGAAVQCNAGTEVPNTAQTGDGTDWGPCFSVTETCGNNRPVEWCCLRA
ncbi:hypothetical protein JB92DRAFT_2830792 [Gautieria morchelliformis]|nr:hypothetical protein JB92DRAFT_2830792 [Gautieria morchelliformis]